MIKNIGIARNKFYCEISEVVINLEGDKQIGTNFFQKIAKSTSKLTPW